MSTGTTCTNCVRKLSSSKKFGVKTQVHQELVRRPAGTIVAKSGTTTIKNPSVLWFQPKRATETLTVNDVPIWLSPADCVRLMLALVETPVTGFRVVWGVSANSSGWLELDNEIGYRPQDDSATVAESAHRSGAESEARRVEGADGDGDRGLPTVGRLERVVLVAAVECQLDRGVAGPTR